jgi:proteasome assembly chaperone (PAC2) family protein
MVSPNSNECLEVLGIDDLIVHEQSHQKLPTMIVAFSGWPDASDSATGAVRYLIDGLRATKFAEIDPEEFFDFTSVRPETLINDEGERVIRWPANEFYYYTDDDPSRNLLLFVGTEPNLKWRAFSKLMVGIAEQSGVELVVSLGALFDAVHHTRDPLVTGRASSPELKQKVQCLGVRNSEYQGPTGIHTAFMDACNKSGFSQASIWGHSPHYVNTSPNPKVTYALLERLKSLCYFDVPMAELQESAEGYVFEVNEVIAKKSDVKAYVKKLEQRYDVASLGSEEMPSGEAMIAEIEKYLWSQEPPDAQE